jgi:hypothetical protein
MRALFLTLVLSASALGGLVSCAGTEHAPDGVAELGRVATWDLDQTARELAVVRATLGASRHEAARELAAVGAALSMRIAALDSEVDALVAADDGPALADLLRIELTAVRDDVARLRLAAIDLD